MEIEGLLTDFFVLVLEKGADLGLLLDVLVVMVNLQLCHGLVQRGVAGCQLV